MHRSLRAVAFVLLALMVPSRARAIGMLEIETGSANAKVEGGLKGNCPVVNGSIGILSAHNHDEQFFFNLGVRTLDTKALKVSKKSLTAIELGIGIRYFPRRPLAWLGNNVALRLTGSGAVGYGFGDGGDDTTTALTAGLALSGRDPIGVMLEAVYRPTSQSVKYDNPDFTTTTRIKVDPWGGARLTVFW